LDAVLRVNQLREQRIGVRLEKELLFLGDITSGGIVSIIPELHQIVKRAGDQVVLGAWRREKLDVEVDVPIQLVLDQPDDRVEQY
jgi:hypothetical protein